MKKILLISLSFTTFFWANAQLCEDFDCGYEYSFSNYWSSYEPSWLTSGRMPWDFLSNAVDQINNCPFSAYQYDNSGECGDCVVSWSFCPSSYTGTVYEGFYVNQFSYLISPLLTIGGSASLHYSVRTINGPSNPDNLEFFDIKLSPQGGSEENDFTVSLLGAFDAVPSDEWNDWYLDLSSYVGQRVRIAFVHASFYEPTDMAGLLIDDVCFHGCIASVEDYSESSFSVYPNPATTNITVRGEGNAEIVNLLGQVLVSEKIYDQANINVSNLESGIYFVRMNGTSKKFIKK